MKKKKKIQENEEMKKNDVQWICMTQHRKGRLRIFYVAVGYFGSFQMSEDGKKKRKENLNIFERSGQKNKKKKWKEKPENIQYTI